MNEKIYKTMARCGAGSIALGIIVLLLGAYLVYALVHPERF